QQSATSRAKRNPNGNLSLPRRCSREEQRANIGARNQQNERECTHDREDYPNCHAQMRLGDHGAIGYSQCRFLAWVQEVLLLRNNAELRSSVCPRIARIEASLHGEPRCILELG